MKFLRLVAVCCSLAILAFTPFAAAATTAPIPSDFNLSVSPSPLVLTVQPGVKTTTELKIHNGSSGAENLQIQPRSFKYVNGTGSVDLQDTTPPAVASWISFSAPKFTVLSGQTFTEKITFDVPKAAGFSYSFALVISRQANPLPDGSEQIIAGSLAVFTLVNVDRPGATSKLEATSFTSAKKFYEYLPATFAVQFTNKGNTIVQPAGNIFVEHGKSNNPLAVLPVNAKQGYILPDTERTITASWNDGFPVYVTTTGTDGKQTQKLVWNWGNLSKLRIGRYTAHLVAVYNQAGRDVPIEGTVSFWVIPWRILLVVLAVVLLVLFALFMLVRMIIKGFKKRRAKRAAKKHASSQTGDTPPQETSHK